MAVDLFPDRPISGREMKAFARQERGEPALRRFRVIEVTKNIYDVLAVAVVSVVAYALATWADLGE